MPRSPADARKLLADLGAPARLSVHVELVGEAAEAVLAAVVDLGTTVDAERVRTGVLIHDVGKIEFPAELVGPGSNHEPAGERMLLERGWDPEVARICRTHARFTDPQCSLEDLLVAVSDKLWKGVRVQELEEFVIDAVAVRLGRDRWDIFGSLADVFDEVASTGSERLERSARGAT